MHWFASLILVLVTWPAFANVDLSRSAHRDPEVTWRAYSARARKASQSTTAHAPITPVDRAVDYDKANLPAVTDWSTEKELNAHFAQLRDVRFLDDDAHPGGKRRSTWLFPDDGCYARAALAIRNLLADHVAVPQKIFVFGDLLVQSPNASQGQVGWWYHVAPIVQIAGQKYVLDPAIEPHHPLKLSDWLARMSTKPDQLQVAVCGSGTYSPYDDCDSVSDGDEATAAADQKEFLPQEWDRLVELGRRPETELGDYPPW